MTGFEVDANEFTLKFVHIIMEINACILFAIYFITWPRPRQVRLEMGADFPANFSVQYTMDTLWKRHTPMLDLTLLARPYIAG